MRQLSFVNDLGLKLIGDLYEPRVQTNCGVIICPGFTSNKDWGFVPELAELLRDKGLRVLVINSTQAIDPPKGTYTQYLKDLRRFIKLFGAKRLGLVGHSMGGAVVLLSAAASDCVVAIAPRATPAGMEKRLFNHAQLVELKKRGYVRYKGYAFPQGFFDDTDKYDLVPIVHKIRTPTMLIHGDGDRTSPVEATKLLNSKMKCERELIIVNGATHHFSESKVRGPMFYGTLRWLKGHLDLPLSLA